MFYSLTAAASTDLASTRILSEKAFVDYLAYLRYWKEPAYAKFVAYPYALFFLDQLQVRLVGASFVHSLISYTITQNAEFRQKLLMDPPFVSMLVKQTENHWRFYRLRRNDISTPHP